MNVTARALCRFIDDSPSPFHCVAAAVQRLTAAGFAAVDDRRPFGPLRPGDGGFVVRGGTVVAWRAGGASPSEAGFRILGAHTDSPNLRIKPAPELTRDGYRQWGVEVYGGVLLHTWLDRDLGLAGRVAVRGDAGPVVRMVDVRRPIARIPSLAIHLDRDVTTKGLVVNQQQHLPPIVGLGEAVEGPGSLAALVAAELECETAELLSWDLCLYDLTPAALGGLAEEFVFSARLDNQASCFTALEALLGLEEVPEATSVVVLFDHEEVGSGSERGASSVYLRDLLGRIAAVHTVSGVGGLAEACANSFMVSADMAHAVHPNYADRHEPQHKPQINAGPVIKVNSNMRYASDAETIARFKAACALEEVPVQDFVTRSDLGCGSTIGPISAVALGIRAVDVGCAMLSMHSIREQAGALDPDWMIRAKRRILRE